MSESLKSLLAKRQIIIAPGVFDLISAKLADQTDVPALYMTGYGTVASYKGLPDAGLATYTDMVDRVAAIAQQVRKPLIADAVPLLTNQVHGCRTPILPPEQLQTMGFEDIWAFERRHKNLLDDQG